MKPITADLILQRWSSLRVDETRQPLNRSLYQCLRQLILEGGLGAGTRLPASRDLAAELSISRNSVTHAYDQLMAEGYVRALTGSGTFVADKLPEQMLQSRRASPARTPVQPRAAARARLSRRGRTLVEGAQAARMQWGAFMPGVPDVREFPHRKFAQISVRTQRGAPPQWFSYASDGGHAALREALAVHLREARSVQCEPDQILITEGVHQAVDLASRVLADPGDRAWMEEPGYWGIRGVLAVNGLKVEGLPVDEEGLVLPVRAPAQPPRLILVSPSHQYPLGSVMSLPRRLALLDFARRQGSWIVEDDYDSEFRFAGHPIPSLQGLAQDAPVIYVGTFSKTLYPGLRVAYMVLPPDLVDPFRKAHAELYREGHLPMQAALAAFIAEGHYAAHIRRMRLIYAERRDALVTLIGRRLDSAWVHPHDSPAGLHLALALPDGADDVAIVQRALTRGVLTQPLSRYYAGRHAQPGLLLGFACVDTWEMVRPFEQLVQSIGRRIA